MEGSGFFLVFSATIVTVGDVSNMDNALTKLLAMKLEEEHAQTSGRRLHFV